MCLLQDRSGWSEESVKSRNTVFVGLNGGLASVFRTMLGFATGGKPTSATHLGGKSLPVYCVTLDKIVSLPLCPGLRSSSCRCPAQ